MPDELESTAGALLVSAEPDAIRRGLELIKARLPELDQEQLQRLFEMVSTLFYIDPLDLPGHVPVLEDAIALTAELGPWVIPLLIEHMEAGDVKAQMAIAQALGLMGPTAIQPLLAQYYGCPEIGCRTFVLFALGKIKSPEVSRAVPAALAAAEAENLEMRDTATRALGKFAESIPAGALADDLRREVIARLQKNLTDASPGVRAKAVRSLGKLAKHGHLTADECSQLGDWLRGILGEDEHFNWDRAYVVRKEAQEALAHLGTRTTQQRRHPHEDHR